MKYLYYTLYCSGHSGLSNLIMSMEIGAILARLMDRVLIVEGNISPPANVVSYGDRVSNRHRSKVTDLIEWPIPWLPAEHVDLDGMSQGELCPFSLMESVFHYPPDLNLDTFAYRRFRRDRRHTITYPDSYRDFDVLSLPGGPEGSPKMHNLSFYSTFFYLDRPARQKMQDLLRRMRPQQPLAELASRVVQRLGEFNAVHIRRGDFKQTPGRTVLLREPREVVERLDQNFSPHELLVVLTDEANDPFLVEVLKHYPHHVILDHFILDEFGPEFQDLPHHDSIALAFLSQLIAAEAKDFVGTMTSTFTSLIQRWRGCKGKEERFKFFWNELPPKGAKNLRGNTPKNELIPLHPTGEMVQEYQGPYSWNRYSPLVNNAWIREWPESFYEIASPYAEQEQHPFLGRCPRLR